LNKTLLFNFPSQQLTSHTAFEIYAEDSKILVELCWR